MTCIVATFAGVWADRRTTGKGERLFRPARKVLRGDGLVAAFAGNEKDIARAVRAVRDGETDVFALAKLSEGVVVNARGRWELSDKTAARTPRSIPIAVGGSGYAEAQAYLYGAGTYDDATIRRALRYVSTVRTDCGDGVDALLLHPR